MDTDVLIVGGGLSGLSFAQKMHQKNIDYIVVEARDRMGGRIHAYDHKSADKTTSFDLGPTWFWPGQQRMLDLVQELKLKPFLQYSDGEIIYEDASGRVMRGQGYASMQGAYRIEGGMTLLIDGLRRQIDAERIYLNSGVKKIMKVGDTILTTLSTKGGEDIVIKSARVVLALPPRVISEAIEFDPGLPQVINAALRSVPTWMAGHAKIVALYKQPFWRNNNLSGDAMSRCGPLMEIHDASPAQSGPYALFGFVGMPAVNRRGNGHEIIEASKSQLIRIFGNEARQPITVELQDWAFEPETSTDLDLAPLLEHPHYGLKGDLKNIWDNSVFLASTEMAPEHGGYLEGALEASEAAAKQLLTASR
jgi:monoamine oxidase